VALNYSLMAAWQACNRPGAPSSQPAMCEMVSPSGWPILFGFIEKGGLFALRANHILKRRLTWTPHWPFALAVVISLDPNQRILISTEAAHAFCEQRSGEICFSIGPPGKNSFHCVYCFSNLFSPFSAQKSHVKPQTDLNHTNKTRSSWHFSST
jgi:hypothetical protein